ncbi:hypothetical protein V6N13_083878 [Hibiscus sabdariffa]
MDAIDSVFDPLREFAKDSVRLVKKCHKPDQKEFTKVASYLSPLTTLLLDLDRKRDNHMNFQHEGHRLKTWVGLLVFFIFTFVGN